MAYYSPETVLGVSHTKKTDVWSVGIYFSALLLGGGPIPRDLLRKIHPIYLIEKVKGEKRNF
jgi:serine/threonine protein kinase